MATVVDQRRSRNARRIERMGGAVASDSVTAEVVLADQGADEDRVIRDASGQIVRVL